MGRTRNESRAEDIRAGLDEKTKSLMRAEERIRELNIDNLMNPTDPLYFPIEKVPYGWVYGWIAIAIMNEPNIDHERAKLKEGWSPVPASRHPEEARNHLDQHDIDSKRDVIIRRGQMLCEIPQAVYEKYLAKRNNDINAMTNSLKDAVQQMPSDPTIPSAILENSDDVTPRMGRTFGI